MVFIKNEASEEDFNLLLIVCYYLMQWYLNILTSKH